MFLRLAFKRAVQIHDVQPLRALLPPTRCHFERLAVNGRIGSTALLQPDCFSAENIDCRINLHNRAKLSRSRSPTC